MRARPWVVALAYALAVLTQACGSTSVTTLTSPDLPRCQVSVGGASTAAASGGSGQISVSTTRDCTWAATASANWISLVPPTTGQGDGSLSYRVEGNGQPTARRATITINTVDVTVSQDPAPCKFAVSPASATVSADGGAVTLAVSTITGCAWTATTDAAWVHLGNGAGNGGGSVRLTIDANHDAARSATVRVGDAAAVIEQSAVPPPTAEPAPDPAPSSPSPDAPAPTSPSPAPSPAPSPTPAPQPCDYSLAATTQSVAATGGTNTVQVHAGSGCAWTATANASWITIGRGTSGSGNGAVTYTAAANTGAQRRATISIADQTLTVTQSAAPAPTPC